MVAKSLLTAAFLSLSLPAFAAPAGWEIQDTKTVVSAFAADPQGNTLAFFCDKDHKLASVFFETNRFFPHEPLLVGISVGDNAPVTRTWETLEKVVYIDDTAFTQKVMMGLRDTGRVTVNAGRHRSTFQAFGIDPVIAAFSTTCFR